MANQAGFMECTGRAKRRRRFRMRKSGRDLGARPACESGVALRLPPQSKIGIGRVGTLQNGGGRVASDFPGTSNKEKTRLTAKLNGGGADLLLEPSGGNVRIRKK